MKNLLFFATLAMAVLAGAVEIKTVPGFNTSSFYIRAAEGEVTSLRYRKVNDKEFLQGGNIIVKRWTGALNIL